jgi:hypothetical protein
MIIIKLRKKARKSKKKKLGGDISMQTEKKVELSTSGSKTFATSAILSGSVETAGLECLCQAKLWINHVFIIFPDGKWNDQTPYSSLGRRRLPSL